MQLAYGIATSTEVAYFTYIYAKISGQHYRLVPYLKDDPDCMRMAKCSRIDLSDLISRSQVGQEPPSSLVDFSLEQSHKC